MRNLVHFSGGQMGFEVNALLILFFLLTASERLQGCKEHIRTDVPRFAYEINKKVASLG